MKMWIARDSNNTLWFHQYEPSIRNHPSLVLEWWFQEGEQWEIDEDLFPEVTFENSPMEVELKLIEK